MYQQISNNLIIIHYCSKLGHLKKELCSIIQCRFTSWRYFCFTFCCCFKSIHHDWLLLWHQIIIYTHAVGTQSSWYCILMKWWQNACFNSSKQIYLTLDFISRYILLWNNFFNQYITWIGISYMIFHPAPFSFQHFQVCGSPNRFIRGSPTRNVVSRLSNCERGRSLFL